MTEGMEAITAGALGLALDAATMRHQAIASNVANAGTPGYERLTVRFEENLDAAREALASHGALDAGSLAGVAPSLTVAGAEGGVPAQVMLDAEMADMARNAVHFQALVKGLSRHYAILSAAVGDGKK